MTRKQPDFWFPAKRYGWGWGFPRVWPGWLVLLAYVGLLVLASLVIRPDVHMKWWVVSIVALSLLLLAVCWWKGEKPGWRWGDARNCRPKQPSDR